MKYQKVTKIFIRIFIWTMVTASPSYFEQAHAEQVQPGPSSPKKEASRLNPDTIRSRINEIQKKFKLIESTESDKTANQLGVPLPRLQEHNANLRQLETIYQRQLTSIERRDSLQKEEENLGRKLESQQESLITRPPPYNLSFYDGLLDELITVKQQEHTIGIELSSGKKVFGERKIKVEQEGHRLRDVTEELQKKGRTDTSLQLSWNLEYAKVAEEVARAFLDLQRITVENVKTELRLAQVKEQITLRHVDWVRSKLAFDQDDLDNIFASLEKRRTILQTNIESLRQGQQDVENEWLRALKELQEAQGADKAVRAKAAAFLEAREAWRETYQKVLKQTETILFFLDREKQFWQYRYGLLKQDVDYDKLESWEKQISEDMDNIERHLKVNEKYHSDLQSEIAALQKQLAYKEFAPEMKPYVTTHAAALHKMAERGFEYLSLLQGTKSTGQRLLDEINLRQKDAGLDQKIKGVSKRVREIWDIELWVIDERSVTVRKVVIALFIFIAGMLAAGLFTRAIIRRILLRTQLDKNATVAIEKIITIFALVILLIVALRSVNIPLTVFTFFGGAIAIGVGFGAQNLLNNFISGFILMAERPVKINDMVEVDNNFGIIENIGMRCTRVRTSGNIHILVPNSSFLEKNIVNWTLSDQEIRAKVVLRVALKSDPREVVRLVLKAAHEHKKVLQTPEAIVLFDDMRASALEFILYFWVSMKSLQLLERRIVESDIRFRIIELFKEAGIVMAYPQRDVHIDTLQPLDLKIDLVKE